LTAPTYTPTAFASTTFVTAVQDVAERLGRHFDTYVLNVRGRGLSEASEGLDYGIDACAADIAGFVAARVRNKPRLTELFF
jgi:hypothetical protein